MEKTIVAASTVLLVSVVLVSCVAPQVQKERPYGSERPLYFRVVFGKEGKASMLGVIDESKGTGTGYDTAYVDENMNNDFADEQPKKFRRNSKTNGWVVRFGFKSPLRRHESVNYDLNIYTLPGRRRGAEQGDDHHFFLCVNTNKWTYFFVNGGMKLSSSAADALKGAPLRLGGECKWEIGSRIEKRKVLVSAELKNENGCTLRSVRGPKKELSLPMLTLIKDGTVEREEKMQFG